MFDNTLEKEINISRFEGIDFVKGFKKYP